MNKPKTVDEIALKIAGWFLSIGDRHSQPAIVPAIEKELQSYGDMRFNEGIETTAKLLEGLTIRDPIRVANEIRQLKVGG